MANILAPIALAVGQTAIKAFMAMAVKIATQEFLEYVYVLTAEALAKSTKTEYDDKVVDKAKEVLNKK
jgi:hypothetical protein